MAFRHLEDALHEDKWTDYFSLGSRLNNPAKSALFYFLDIAALVRKSGLGDEALTFGGYAILSHLAGEYGDGVIPTWRGSDDVDMAGSERVRQLLHRTYSVTGDNLSPNLLQKRTIKLLAEGEPECKIDFYTGDASKRYEREERIVLGIPVNVASPLSLVRAKLEPQEKEDTHRNDIYMMLAVLEKRGYSPETVVNYFNRQQRGQLRSAVKAVRAASASFRMGIQPSAEFVGGLSHKLKRS